MSDLDFDELDKAVNTLMGDVPKVEPVKAEEVKTLNINSTLDAESRPSLEKLDSELAKVNSVTPAPAEKPSVSPAPAPSLATRRGGRFMDVVHPSSDMKGMARPAALMARQGVTIEPTASAPQVKDSNVDAVKEVNSNNDTVAVIKKPTPEVRDTESDAQNDWPDPLDMPDYGVEPDTGSAATAVTVSTSVVTAKIEDIEDDAEATELQSLASPFLPDAKVEKRPLGGAPVEEVLVEDDEIEEPSHAPVLGVLASEDVSNEDAAGQLPATPRQANEPLPPELQSDLMAIETDGGTSAEEQEVTAPVVTEAPVEKKPDTSILPVGDKKPLGSSVPATAPTPTGPTSIPQQYHEEPTTSDQTNGSIYDTESYHQPLAHPTQAKSGWLWIIWILLLLLVGGGGAVALYFMGVI